MEGGGGSLVLVVGPSGVGKDTLISGAREALRGDPGFVFVKRIVTRHADTQAEDHDSLDVASFDQAEAAGHFSLSWRAHGLRYALPGSVASDVARGRIVVANGSRHVVGDAMARFARCRVMLITAEMTLRAERLAARGRETGKEIAARLAREGAPLPQGVEPIVVDNSGTLASGIAAFVSALRSLSPSRA
ncbi:phosphonate metabolism protein/1,5-bisphosphokinase (PRPP-forming) PhnN [Devosia nitrariae]|uniref:Ribose 1,5-bisphosphate phosphokinase PhnN n=1 Tax=Devosia nitrariae TaxID=2071872 RepID=A0ABQ5W8I4_9HYPH|nr:phosphonate metabolism protein/1,5-bisphosphokinase (PRPP-forming) PhnN [Devosia nitrariae]GLQ55936.1 ribose 1,5-bisphosphate phosphokinase PhnN [Devosia nitrariae]